MSTVERVTGARNGDSPSPGMAGVGTGHVVIFAPSPELTITIEDHAENGDIHIHAGGQGLWQARMVRSLKSEVTLCASFAGETGKVLQHLLDDEDINFVAV